MLNDAILDAIDAVESVSDFNALLNKWNMSEASQDLKDEAIRELKTRKSIFDLVGKYDEKSKIFEDVPFLLKVFSSNAKISYFSKITVKYREGGISNSNSVKFDKELLKIFFKYRIKFLNNDSILDRIVILERRLYNLLLDKKKSKTLLLKIYCRIYTKYLKLINRIY